VAVVLEVVGDIGRGVSLPAAVVLRPVTPVASLAGPPRNGIRDGAGAATIIRSPQTVIEQGDGGDGAFRSGQVTADGSGGDGAPAVTTTTTAHVRVPEPTTTTTTTTGLGRGSSGGENDDGGDSGGHRGRSDASVHGRTTPTTNRGPDGGGRGTDG